MSSPSEFLTFYRRFAARPVWRQIGYTPSSSRTFVSTIPRYSSGVSSDSKHATNKTDQLDVQSDNSAKGQKAKAQDDGGSATQQKDSLNSTSKAKKDHPEAPDVVIGMQDERGGKGA